PCAAVIVALRRRWQPPGTSYRSVLLSRPGGMPMSEPQPAAVESAFLSMPLEEAMRTQRAIRRLKPDPVDDALILHLITLAQKAPTGSNAQNWEFVVVKDRAVKERLASLNRMAWRLYGGIGRWLARNDPPMQRIIQAVQWQADH